MREYVWVIIVVVGLILIATIIVSLCIVFYKTNRYRSRQRRISPKMQVQPSTATPISAPEMVPKETYLKLSTPGYDKNGLKGLRTRSSAPPVMMFLNNSNNNNNNNNGTNVSPEKKASFIEMQNNLPVRSLSTVSARSPVSRDDRPFGSTFTLRPKRSAEFIDRDPISDESRSDYLDPLDFGTLHKVHSESQISPKPERSQFASIECIYREDRRYLHT